MANKRMISRALSKSRKVLDVFQSGNSLSDFAMLLYCMGIPYHDEKGMLSADPHDWKYDICPLSSHPVEEFETAIKVLIKSGLLKKSPCGKAVKYINHDKIQSYRQGRAICSYFPDIKDF